MLFSARTSPAGRAVLAAWAGCGLVALTAGAASAAPAGVRPAAFAACTACHSTVAGKNGIGPSLAGVAGRTAGSLPGFSYSKALQNADIVWDAASLDKWLTSPQQAIPGNRMPFPGVPDPVKRRLVVEYLLTLK